jgi:hypothetical protein
LENNGRIAHYGATARVVDAVPQPPDSNLSEMGHAHHFSSRCNDVFQVVGVMFPLADGLAGSGNSNPATDQQLQKA